MTTCIRRPHSTWTECRCDTCKPAMRKLKKRHDAGLLPRARIDEAFDVLNELIRRGWGHTALASATGIPMDTFERILKDLKQGHRTYLSRKTADRIINHGNPTAGHIGATGARRRLQALAAMGYTLEPLVEATGLPMMTLSVIRGGRVDRTGFVHHQAIADAFDKLAMKPGPSNKARLLATKNGWVGPLAWDDIDDPDETPAETRKPRRPTDPILDLDEFLFLLRTGETPRAAARRCGVSIDAVALRIKREQRTDVQDAITQANLRVA